MPPGTAGTIFGIEDQEISLDAVEVVASDSPIWPPPIMTMSWVSMHSGLKPAREIIFLGQAASMDDFAVDHDARR